MGRNMPNMCLVIVLCGMILTPVLSQWSDPWITLPPQGSTALDFVAVDVTSTSATLTVAENITIDGTITVVLKYTGDSVPNQKSGGTTTSTIFLMKATGSGNDGNLFLKDAVDYEAIRSYTYTYEFGANIRVLTVKIGDVNDNVPYLDRPTGQLKFPENTKGTVYNFTAKDADALDKNKLTYLLQVDDPYKEYFQMNTINQPNWNVGQLSVIKPLDYETANLYLLDIFVTDTAGQSSSLSLNLQVDDKADEAPRWSVIQPVVNLKESGNPDGSQINDNVTKVLAYDGDLGVRAQIVYAISGDQASYFNMDSKTGQLTLAKEVDRDTGDTYLLVNITASEASEPTSRADFQCTIFLDDINDNAPTFNGDVFYTSVYENSRGALSFSGGDIRVVDMDLGAGGRYQTKIEQPFSDQINISPTGFSAQNTTYILTVANSELLDYENPNRRNVTFKLTVTEEGDTSHRDETLIIIEVKDLNDNQPLFLDTVNGGYIIDVMENATKGFKIIQVQGADEDVSPEFGAASLIYSLVPTDYYKSFAISQDGTVTYTAAAQTFDRETQEQWEITLQLADGNDYFNTTFKTTATLTINLLDVNDTPPKITTINNTGSVIENCKPDTVVMTGITASDADTNPDLVVSINFSDSKFRRNNAPVQTSADYDFTKCFTVKPTKETDGSITAEVLVGTLSPDRERFDSVDLVIQVEDKNTEAGVSIAKLTLSITVSDVNDNPPTFLGKYTDWEIQENNKDGTIINQVRATDVDENANNVITYNLDSCTFGDGLLEVNLTTGAVIAREINRETTPNITCVISACDNDDPPLTTPTDIFIRVGDLNDVTPHFVDFPTSKDIFENASNGTIITTVVAEDEDEGFYGYIMYIFSQNNVEGMDEFEVNSTTGVVTVKNSNLLDFDKGKKQYLFFIDARDNFQYGAYSGSNVNSTRITVNLLDVNDNEPVFPKPPASGCYALVSEGKPKDTQVITIQAIDIDEPGTPRSTIDYKLLGTSEFFRVDSTSQGAVVTVDSDNLRGNVGNYTLIIQASDNGTPPKASSESYVMCVTDENDNSPIFQFPTQKGTIVYVQETNAVNAPVKYYTGDSMSLNSLVFYANDTDTGNNALVTYAWETESSKAVTDTFELNSQTGLVTLIKALNKGQANNYTLNVVASDHGVPDAKSTLTNLILYVRAESKYDPVFNITSQSMTFQENNISCQGFRSAYDLDNANLLPDEKGDPVAYFVVGGSGEYFSVNNHSESVICTKKELDREDPAQQNLYVLIQVTNGTEPTILMADPSSNSFLRINVTIQDVNDNAPVFRSNVVSAGIWPNSPTDVVRVQASDPDEDDAISYTLQGAFSISDSSLQTAMTSTSNVPFKLDEQTGIISARFTVQPDMRGYFQCMVQATDKVSNSSTATLKIYIVNVDENQVTIYFLDPLETVESHRLDIEQIFTDVYEYVCNVESISQGQTSYPDNNRTKVLSHFIDDKKSEPVPKTEIEKLKNNFTKTSLLRTKFTAIGLSLDEIRTVNPSEDVKDQTFFILFIVICVALVPLVILLFIVLMRSNELNRRVKALSATQFGSQDSGLNRVGATVPNTNKHAIEGSNPIWNADERVLPQDDAVSQSSGDSVLIGVEDNPEFRQYKNKGYEPDRLKLESSKKPKSSPTAVNRAAVRKLSAPNLEPYEPSNARDTRRPSEPNFNAFPLEQNARTNPLFAMDTSSQLNHLKAKDFTGTGKRRAPSPPELAEPESDFGEEAIYDELNSNFSFGNSNGKRTEL